MDSAAYIKVFLSPAADVELETADSPRARGPARHLRLVLALLPSTLAAAAAEH